MGSGRLEVRAGGSGSNKLIHDLALILMATNKASAQTASSTIKSKAESRDSQTAAQQAVIQRLLSTPSAVQVRSKEERTVMVSNLPVEIRCSQVRAIVQKCGAIEKVCLVRPSVSGATVRLTSQPLSRRSR